MENDILVEKIKTYIDISSKEEKKIYYDSVSFKDITFMKVRDSLFSKGKILEEDFKNQIYVVEIKSGAANLNPCVVAIQLKDEDYISLDLQRKD